MLGWYPCSELGMMDDSNYGSGIQIWNSDPEWPWQATLGTSWKEKLYQQRYDDSTIINLESNILSTLKQSWWIIPWLVAAYLIMLLGLTAVLIVYLSHQEQNSCGRPFVPRRRRRHLCQIQSQRL